MYLITGDILKTRKVVSIFKYSQKMICNIYLRLGNILGTCKIVNIFKYTQNTKRNIYLRFNSIFETLIYLKHKVQHIYKIYKLKSIF